MKRALFVSSVFPHDLNTSVHGGFIRMRMLLQALSAEADELDLLFFVQRPPWLQGEVLTRFQGDLNSRWGLSANLTLCDRTEASATLRRHLLSAVDARNEKIYARVCGEQCVAAIERCLEHQPDLIFAHHLDSMCPLLSMRRPLPPVIFDFDDIEHRKRLREFRQPKARQANKLYKVLRLPAVVRLERQAVQLARSTFVCSEHDRRYLERWLYPSGVEVVVNAMDIPPALSFTEPTMTVGFIGTFRYSPNVKAAEELVTRIWPRVRARLPQSKLVVAGAHPERIPCVVAAQVEPAAESGSDAGIEFSGFVPEVDQFYKRLQLICCPIRFGGGTRIKIIEAAALGLPVVATRMAAEGLDFVDGVEIVLAETPDAIAQACVELLSDPARCREIGIAARARAISSYQRRDVVASIRTRLRILAQTSSS